MTKILLVEDDNSLREIYGVRLLAEGYTVVSAEDGERALALAISEKPDLIISDVMMPRISGFEMLDLLRGNEATKNIRVIMLTALSSERQRERGDSLGADRYLVKSQVGIEDIVRTVHDVLGDQPSQPSTEQARESKRAAEQAQLNAQQAQRANIVNQTYGQQLPLSGQSAYNPLAATAPNIVANRPAPNLPNNPVSVPTYVTPPVEDTAPYYTNNQPVYRNNLANKMPVTDLVVDHTAPQQSQPTVLPTQANDYATPTYSADYPAGSVEQPVSQPMQQPVAQAASTSANIIQSQAQPELSSEAPTGQTSSAESQASINSVPTPPLVPIVEGVTSTANTIPAPTSPIVPTVPTAPTAPTVPTAPTAPTAPTVPTVPTAPTAPTTPTSSSMTQSPSIAPQESSSRPASSPKIDIDALLNSADAQTNLSVDPELFPK